MAVTQTVGDLDFTLKDNKIIVSHHGFPLITKVVDKVKVAELYREVEDMVCEATQHYLSKYYIARLIEL